jgi:hypothetical protein
VDSANCKGFERKWLWPNERAGWLLRGSTDLNNKRLSQKDVAQPFKMKLLKTQQKFKKSLEITIPTPKKHDI